MHQFIIATLLGIIEGVTEFLPVSSTAHLRLAQQFLFHIDAADPFWKMFAIVIQLGAVLCLPTYFWREILRLLRSFPWRNPTVAIVLAHPLVKVMIAFACTAVPALLLRHKISANLENFYVIGAALLIGGALMWAVDVLFDSPRTTAIDRVSMPQSIWIGLIQTLSAVFPGTSRSMSTIAAGQVGGLSRAAALEFSFFLCIPTMAAATLFDLFKAIHPGKDVGELAPLTMTANRWALLAVGMVVSYAVALAVVAFFMAWVRKRGFTPFAVYRIVLGLLVLIAARHGAALR